MDCTFDMEYGNIGCRGGKISQTLLYALDEGTQTDKSYPYTANDEGDCLHDKNQTIQRIRNYIRLPRKITEDFLKDALVHYGPLIIGINGSSRAFQFYKSGVFFDPNCRTFVNHAVVSGNLRVNLRYIKFMYSKFSSPCSCTDYVKFYLLIRNLIKFINFYVRFSLVLELTLNSVITGL